MNAIKYLKKERKTILGRYYNALKGFNDLNRSLGFRKNNMHFMEYYRAQLALMEEIIYILGKKREKKKKI